MILRLLRHKALSPSSTRVVCWTALLAAVAGAPAEEPVFYSSGQARPLLRSDTEFAVELEVVGTADDVRASALASGAGVLKPIPGTRQVTNRGILEVAQTTPQARQAASAVPGVKSVRPVYRLQPDGQPYLSTGELIVRVQRRLSEAQRNELFDDYGVRLVREVRGLSNVCVVVPAGATDDEVALAAEMHRDPRTVYGHPNFSVKAKLHQVRPADEFFDEQWHLQNVAQGGGTPGADIDVLSAWETTLGAGVLVGVFDDGVDLAHEDLDDNYIGISQDLFSGAVSADAAQPSRIFEYHGTAVTGLIVAEANDVGVRGVAPEARFTATRGLEENVLFDQFALPFVFAEEEGVDVHNNSWGIGLVPPVVVDAIQSAFENGRDGLGMVILFSSGNDGELMETGDDPSTLRTVIGVGGSTAEDKVSFGSNYGPDIDVLAPTNIYEFDLPSVVTTDVTDGRYLAQEYGWLYVVNGYNDEDDMYDWNPDDLEDSSYTNGFGGTSASCPIATGVAALVLSVNPALTATQVRVLLEHTTDMIEHVDPDNPSLPGEADYHGITRRSLRYGYGRINAGAAVAAAQESLTTEPPNLTWPDRPANVVLIGDDTLVWERNDDLRGPSEAGDRSAEFLVVQRIGLPFEWTPEDGRVYTVGEPVGDNGETVVVQIGDDLTYTFEGETPQRRYLGIYARNAAGKYSWGVAADSDGNIEGADDKTVVIPTGPIAPRVTAAASPLSGETPLTVEFRGNAQTDSAIVSQLWDFGDGTTDTRGTATHTYTIPDGTSQSFEATFTVEDEDGDIGSKSLTIHVTSPGADDPDDDGPDDGGETISIVLTDADGATLDANDEFPAPFRVNFSVELSQPGVEVVGVRWEFGDGSPPVEARSATHVYEQAGSFAVSVEVITQVAPDVTSTLSATETVQVVSDGAEDGDGDDDGTTPDGGSTASTQSGRTCGVGIVMPFVGLLLMALWHRRLR
ncbi:MAG: S8 family serine peptidase [Phycisphaerales bacterium]|nr:MAG: S8 family serine peptidase [Phycisphaerales bacterium]